MKTNDFIMAAHGVVEKMKGTRSESTLANYSTAIRSLDIFFNDHPQQTQLDEQLLSAYQFWLQQKGICLNTVSCYIRSLRSIYNLLVGNTLIFNNAFTGGTRTRKRSLSVEDVKKLKALRLKGMPQLEMARNLFLFSIYALGMPFVDMAFMKKENVQFDSIYYMRHKTNQPVFVPLEPCMKDIIRKYQHSDTAYLFPILTTTEQPQAYLQYQNKLNSYNRLLKKLSSLAGLNVNLSSYVVRHTWASLAYSSNVELNVISKALGHTNTNTTQIYIRELEDYRLKDANHVVLGAIFSRRKRRS
ncbi:MAG: site-specific integrase [Bacteroidales bacterium]|nr:site-specific integrase [Bacteroidales bacterium]